MLDTLPKAFSISTPTVRRGARLLNSPGLPSSQSLLDVTLREIEETITEYIAQCRLICTQLQPGDKSEMAIVNHCRQSLRDIYVSYQRSCESTLIRTGSRHHGDGRFGSIAAWLRTAITEQAEKARRDERLLGEFATEPKADKLAADIRSLVDAATSAAEQLNAELKRIQTDVRREQPIILASHNRLPFDEPTVKQRFATILTRWWESSIESPGPMTIALVDVNRACAECPEFGKADSIQFLKSLAGFIKHRKSYARTGEAPFSLETSVISGDTRRRTIAWSCTVIESDDGSVAAIIAAGLERGGAKTIEASSPAMVSVAQANSFTRTSQQDSSERRKKPRQPFPFVQLIAPASGTALPHTSEFKEAKCYDVSEDGFSFYSPAMPSSSSVVVALGTCAPHIYMTARVANFRRLNPNSGDQYIVGCQFTGRAMLLSSGN